MKKIFDITMSAIMAIVLIAAFLLVGVRLFGLAPYTVLSGSMEPTYHVGSLIYVKSVDPNELQIDDPITYVIGDKTIVTHRIIDIAQDDKTGETLFYTKGDNNDDPDGTPVRAQSIIGKPVFTVPLVGYFVFYVQRPPWNAIAIGMLVVILGFAFLPDMLDKIFGEGDAVKKEPEKTESDPEKTEYDPEKIEPDALPTSDEASEKNT